MSEQTREVLSDFYCDTKIAEIKQELQADEQAHILNKKERIIKWAELLENKAVNGSYNKPVETITAHIVEELRSMQCLSGMPYIYRILPDRYKQAKYIPNLSEAFDKDANVPLGEHGSNINISLPHIVSYETASHNDLMEFIEKSDDLEHEYDRRSNDIRSEKNKAVCVAKTNGWPLRIKTPDVERTELPFTKFKGKFWEVNAWWYEEVVGLAKTLKDISTNLEDYPITDLKWNEEAAEAVADIAEMFAGIGDYMRPYADKKWAQDLPQWFETEIKFKHMGKHGAAVKSKIPAWDDPEALRPLTREQVGDRIYKLHAEQLRWSETVKKLTKWARIYSQWRRDGKMDNVIAKRRIKVGPKLSSSAFGSDKS